MRRRLSQSQKGESDSRPHEDQAQSQAAPLSISAAKRRIARPHRIKAAGPKDSLSTPTAVASRLQGTDHANRHFRALRSQPDRPPSYPSLLSQHPRRRLLAGRRQRRRRLVGGTEDAGEAMSSLGWTSTMLSSHQITDATANREGSAPPTKTTVHSCADRSQTQVPILATIISPSHQDQSTTQQNSSCCFDSSPSSSIDSNTTPNASNQHPAKPIPIVCTPKDPNKILTPLSGRGERKGRDYFALARSPSPRGRRFPIVSPELQDGRDPESSKHRRRSSSSHSHLSRSLFVPKMHPDQLGTTRYTPTSPLSPRLPPAGRPVSPQPSRARTAAHRRQPSRNLQLNLGRFHPSNYQSNSQLAKELSTSEPACSGLTYQRMPQAESPRLMRDRQRELIDRARMSSRIAASPMGVKPERPTLAPLGSPKDNVTPLELERSDYFETNGAERVSPAQSPGAISNQSTKEFGEELARETPKPEGYH